MYHVELVWNREFNWVRHGDSFDNLDSAIAFAKSMENSGDGARVKKTCVKDEEGKFVWMYGKLATKSS
jgi:hypothetical protein